MIRRGLFGPAKTASPSQIPAQADGAFALHAAEQGIVLLKNAHGELPLAASTLPVVAVIGPYAGAAMTGGDGSSHVDPLLTVSPVRGIGAEHVAVTYNDGSDVKAAAAAARRATVAIVMVGDTESEGRDQPSLALPGNQDQLIEAVARANPRTVVVVKSGNPVLMPWLAQVPASASRTPTSSASQFPGTNGKVEYSEGLDVGYRGYDAENITPLFPFGFGLSYTTFKFTNLTLTPSVASNTVSGPAPSSCGCNGQGTTLATARVTVTNTGAVTGTEVAQLYLGDPKAAGEPPRQLKGFARVTLSPGQSATLSFPLTGHDLSYWDDAAGGWVVPAGPFMVYAGDSSALASLPLRAHLTITKTIG
jgi:beta-glucosidase